MDNPIIDPSVKTVLSDKSCPNPDCKHIWIWSNRMGMYYCEKCNGWSYLGKD